MDSERVEDIARNLKREGWPINGDRPGATDFLNPRDGPEEPPDPAHYARALKQYAAEDWENPDDDRPETPDTPGNPADAFHARIAADPEDATTALVYADWLAEHGLPAHEKVVRAHAERYGTGGNRRPGDEYTNLAAPGVPWHTAVTAEPMGGVMVAPDRSTPTPLDGIWDVHLAKQVGGSPPAVRWRVPHLHGTEAAALIRELTAESQRMGGGTGVIHNSNARNLVNHLGRAEAVGQPRTGIREVGEGGESPTLLARAVAGGLRRYASRQDVAAMTAGMTPTDWRGGHGADMTKRSVLADAIHENGDEHTANLLRTPGVHLYRHAGGIHSAHDLSAQFHREYDAGNSIDRGLERPVTDYINTALWSSVGQDDEPLDENYTPDDIHPDTMAALVADARHFHEVHGDKIGDDPRGYGNYHFWTERNGHGVGFNDHPDYYGEENADSLSDAARSHGEYDLGVGDDGMIHGSYEAPPAADPPVEEADRPPPGGPLTDWPLPDHYRRVGAALKRYALYRAPAGGMIAPPVADPLFAGLPGQFVPGGKFVSGAAIEPQKKSEGGRKRFDLGAIRRRIKTKKLRDDPSSYGPGADALTVSYARALKSAFRATAVEYPEAPGRLQGLRRSLGDAMKRYAAEPTDHGAGDTHGAFLDSILRNHLDDTAKFAHADFLQDAGYESLPEAIRRSLRVNNPATNPLVHSEPVYRGGTTDSPHDRPFDHEKVHARFTFSRAGRDIPVDITKGAGRDEGRWFVSMRPLIDLTKFRTPEELEMDAAWGFTDNGPFTPSVPIGNTFVTSDGDLITRLVNEADHRYFERPIRNPHNAATWHTEPDDGQPPEFLQ